MPASAGQCTRATAPKGNRDAPPTSQGQYAAPMHDDNPPSSLNDGDAPPLREGRYAMPATPGHDDKSTSKSPASESASTIRRLPLLRPLLGPQQIDSLMKSQYSRKIGKLPDSFATIIEQGREETPTPSLTPPSARSHNSGGFELFPHPKRHTRTGAVSVDSELCMNMPSASNAEAPSIIEIDAGASLSPQTQMSQIRVIAEDVHHRSGEDDDLLGTLQLIFNKEKLRSIFPRQIEDCPPVEGSELRQFAFNQDYISHLASVMMLSCNMLNEFLRAAGSERMFSYGSSKYYDGQMFKEVLYPEWPAQTIALSLEKRLLERIAMAHRAISLFIANAKCIPGRGMPRLVSPAFTDNSSFAKGVAKTLLNAVNSIAFPWQEDAAWTSEIEGEAQASCYQATSGEIRAQSRPPSRPTTIPAEGNEADDEGDRCSL